MAQKEAVTIDVRIVEGKDGLKKLAFDADALQKIMEKNIQVAKRFEQKVFSFAALTSSINAVNNAFGALSSTLDSLTGDSEEFSKAMRAANTMAGKDAAGFEKLKDDVADLAKTVPIARDALATGLYQVISNGVPEDNWLSFLENSARSAVGGLADINKVVGVTSTLIKNYGLEWSSAADIQDKIQLTAKNGVTSFEQLAQALPRVAGNAATLGVSIDELMGTFATLTGVSGNTAEVSTQLAAIFTALVKPSSEAADMAAKMGIQFDAAAINAAGGFQNFLSQLDASVRTYAQSTGVLEQEVYAKLFGSAEALRALIPLQGELADKFSVNIANMVDSAGTMDAAYADMSSTSEAVTQKLRNQWASVTDFIANTISGFKPVLNYVSEIGQASSSIYILVKVFKQLNTQPMIIASRAKLAKVALAALGLQGKSTAAVMRVFGSAMKEGAYSATAFKIALRGLLTLSGIGVAIFAVSEVIGYFTDKANDAAESAEKLDDATDEYTRAAADAKVQIDSDIKALGELIKSKKDTTDAVKHLNEAYGDVFGTYETAEKWYEILTQKSQQYIKQIGYEAQAKALASKVAEASINKELALKRKEDLEQAGVDSRGRIKKDSIWGEVWVESEEYKQALKDIEAAEAEEAELQKRLNTIGSLIEKNKKGLASENGKGSGNGNDKGQPKTPTETPPPAGSLADITKKISAISAKIQLEVDPASRVELYNELQKLEFQKRRIEFEYKFPEAPERPDIMPDLGEVETDIAKIKPEIIDVSDVLGGMQDKTKVTADTMAGAFGELGSSIAGLGNALELPELNVAGTIAQAIATLAAGFAKASEQSWALGPFGWMAFTAAGLAQLTATVAAVKSLPAFANGGIVSGPTVGLIGEYAGASSNPEVIAPLDKLRTMLNPAGQPVIVGGTLRASGRDIVCVLANETRISSKSGKRTNIKL